MTRVVLFLVLSWAGVQAQTLLVGALQWKEMEVKVETKGNIGKIPASFEFKNTGKKPVTITGITTSCGCTVAASSQTSYSPGESGTINLEYTPTPTAPPGVRYYHAGVTTDESPSQTYALKLQVVYNPRIALDKRLLVWEKGEARSAKVIKLTPDPGDPLRIVGAKGERDLFNFSLKDGERPGEKLLTVSPKMFAGVTGGKTRIDLITEPPLGSPAEAQIFAILR